MGLQGGLQGARRACELRDPVREVPGAGVQAGGVKMDPRLESGKLWIEARVRELSRQRGIDAQTLTWETISAPALEDGIALGGC